MVFPNLDNHRALSVNRPLSQAIMSSCTSAFLDYRGASASCPPPPSVRAIGLTFWSCGSLWLERNWGEKMSEDEEWDAHVDECEPSGDEESDQRAVVSASAGATSKGGRGQQGKVGATKQEQKPRGKAKEKAKAKKNVDFYCFAAECPERRKTHSRWCPPHHRLSESMLYQAGKAVPPQTAALNQVLSDPGKARLALDSFSSENCEGRFRKKLIDWTSFQRTYGVRLSLTERENQELMDVDDWIVFQKNKKGKERDEAMSEWRKMLESNWDGEGEGAARKLWIDLNKTRLRDRTRYVDQSALEGSRQIKNATDQDRQHLQSYITNSRNSFTDGFFRNSEAAASSDPTIEVVEVAPVEDTIGRGKRVEVAIVAPKEREKFRKAVADAEAAMGVVVQTAEKTLAAAKERPDQDDSLLSAYTQTTSFRMRLVNIFMASSVEMITSESCVSAKGAQVASQKAQ